MYEKTYYFIITKKLSNIYIESKTSNTFYKTYTSSLCLYVGKKYLVWHFIITEYHK